MRRKPFHVFLLHAAFVMGLMAAWSGAREIYPSLFHAIGNEVFESMGDGLSVHFEWGRESLLKRGPDTRMIGRQEGRFEYRWQAFYSSFRRGFWPSATLLALTVAAPMSRWRRALVLPLGFVSFHVALLLQVAVFAWVLFGTTEPGGVESWAAGRRAVTVCQAVFNSPVTNYAVVFLLFTALCQPGRAIDMQSLAAAARRALGRPGAPPHGRPEREPTGGEAQRHDRAS
ncbi:MAG: hypothetical protein ACE5FL_06995 [Myxococcota bacterium]